MTFYKCDTNKAITCKKTTCYIYGGNCFLTSNEKYAIDPNKPYKEKRTERGQKNDKSKC